MTTFLGKLCTRCLHRRLTQLSTPSSYTAAMISSGRWIHTANVEQGDPYPALTGEVWVSCYEFKNHEHSVETELPQEEDLFDPDDLEQMPLYEDHIPTTFFQKGLLGVGSAYMSLTRPWRDDMIATFGEVTGPPSLQYMRSKMLKDPVGRRILEEMPRINSTTVDLDALRSLPPGTFGREYINFLDTNGVTPDSRRPVNFVDDAELAYVMQRYREVHDLLHTVLGMPTNMLGEVTVKWVEGLQFGLPLGLTGGMFGALRLGPKHRSSYLNTHLWWALRVGTRARCLLNVYYEEHWDWTLEQLREHLNIEEPPPTPQKRKMDDS